MNAYNPLASMKRLEDADLERRHAEAIAAELRDSTTDLVTKEQLDAALDKQTIKLGALVAAIVVLACTVLGAVLSAL